MADLHTLPCELTIYTVGETYPVCLAWLDSDGEDLLQVDASQVSEVDAAGVQLLLALANGLRRRERGLQLQDPSPALTAACESLGTTALIAPADSTGVPA